MNPLTTEAEGNIWQGLVHHYKKLNLALARFLFDEANRIPILREALKTGDRAAAIYVASHLKTAELMELFEEFVFLASFSHGGLAPVRQVILSLPRDWVLSRIENVVSPLIERGTYDEYRRFLELYSDLNHQLALNLANKAAQHSDEDIREAGKDFIEYLNVFSSAS